MSRLNAMRLPPFARAGRGDSSAPTALTGLLGSQSSLGMLLLAFSAGISVLTLSVAIYMLQVYDRVLSSQSKDTLFFLTVAVIFAVGLSSVLEGVRQQVANRVGTWLAQRLGPLLLARSLEQRLTIPGMRLEALRELATLKSFISTPTIFNIVDMLWIPLFLLVTFLLHPWFGGISLVGALTLFALAYLNESSTRATIRAAQAQSQANMQYAESLVRNSEVIDAMGMADDAVRHWSRTFLQETRALDATQGRSGKILAASKFVRYFIQIALLAVGALLVINLELTAGAMVAGSIIVARLLAPIEASISNWKQFVLARHSFARLQEFFRLPRPRPSEMCLPEPRGDISVFGLTYVPPGIGAAILRNVSFSISAGEMLAIVGPSASGKTTLSRLLVGVLQPTAGNVRLDGADTFDWKRSDLGPRIGYLPQDIELLPGSVRANISRFRLNETDERVVAAAGLADCHDMILGLRGGYDMVLGDGGFQLSGGQRQRVGLARALFGNPRLVVLDEPNSSLDAVGEAALLRTLAHLKRAGVTTIVVAHRTNLLKMADRILVLREGSVMSFGPAQQVLAQFESGSAAAAAAKPNPIRPPSRSGQQLTEQGAREFT